MTNKETYLIINLIFSSVICLLMYTLTAVLFAIDGIVLHEESAGIVALILYFIVPFMAIWELEFTI